MSLIGPITHGVVLALGLIIALGPQNVIVFQQGATQPRLGRALPTILTAGMADTLFILLAVLGVSVVVLQFEWARIVLFGGGFVFLLYIGWTFLRSPILDFDSDEESPLAAREQITFTASVSFLNPHAILDTIGVIGTNALAYTGFGRWAFAGACIAVSWGWFVGLATAGRFVGTTAGATNWIRWLNYVSALIIWGVAAYMGWQFFQIVQSAGWVSNRALSIIPPEVA